ncbi:MAG: hypothetical protein ACI4OY_13175 [Aristaeellaceae bacterium]
MKNRGKKGGAWLKILTVALLVALIAVVAVIVWKQHEYSTSDEFYGSLRGALPMLRGLLA